MPNPNVILTDHVLDRCKSRNFNPQRVRQAVRSIPPFTGTLKWHVHGFGTVVVQMAGQAIRVLTVHSGKRQYTRKATKIEYLTR